MKKFVFIISFFILILTPQVGFTMSDDAADEMLEATYDNEVLLKSDSLESQNALEDVEELYTDAEVDNKVFEKIGAVESNNSESSLFHRIFESKITRTDIPTFLMKDEVTVAPENGPIGKLEPFLAYRGSISTLFNRSTSTKYDNLVTEVGVLGELKNPNYKFKVTIFPIPNPNSDFVRNMFSDIYIMNTSIPNHQVYLGYFRIQTGMEGGSSTYTLPFVSRSQIARNFGNKRSLGTKIVGNYEYLDYVLSVGSSSRSLIGGMQGAEFNAWVNVKPFGKKEEKYGRLTIGTGYDGGRSLSHNFSVVGGYVGYKYKKLWTNFEVAVADGYHGSTGSHRERAYGYAYTLGWKFTPYFQLIGRIDQFDPNKSIAHDLKREYTLGINWFIKGQALKLMLNYVFCDNQNSRDSHKIILATQILL